MAQHASISRDLVLSIVAEMHDPKYLPIIVGTDGISERDDRGIRLANQLPPAGRADGSTRDGDLLPVYVGQPGRWSEAYNEIQLRSALRDYASTATLQGRQGQPVRVVLVGGA